MGMHNDNNLIENSSVSYRLEAMLLIRRITNDGGGGGIRTLASLSTTNGLANRPLQPLGYSSGLKVIVTFSVL